jgi:hypothetical protein
MKNATEFCKAVEARLGWVAPNLPAYARYRVEAAKVKRKIETNPDLYTWRNLELAIELLSRERKSRNPMGVFAHVERAVEMAVEPEADIETQIREAIRYETPRGDPAGWVARLTRAVGHYRSQALREWQESVR